MDESRVYYAKRNKSDRERQIPYDLTYMWNLKNKTKENENTLLDTHNKWVYPKGGVWDVGDIGEGD